MLSDLRQISGGNSTLEDFRDPAFWEEALASWREQKAEEFGARWPAVQAILAVLEANGIFMLDAHPGNICLPD